jgi:hypothetical protein
VHHSCFKNLTQPVPSKNAFARRPYSILFQLYKADFRTSVLCLTFEYPWALSEFFRTSRIYFVSMERGVFTSISADSHTVSQLHRESPFVSMEKKVIYQHFRGIPTIPMGIRGFSFISRLHALLHTSHLMKLCLERKLVFFSCISTACCVTRLLHCCAIAVLQHCSVTDSLRATTSLTLLV